MAEQFNCKPRELDDIINAEHSLLQKLRASGLSDSELLEMVGITVADSSDSETDDNGKAENSSNADRSECNADDDSDDGDDRDDEST